MTNDLLAQRSHKRGAQRSPRDFRDWTLHGETEVRSDLDVELASRHFHRDRAFHQPEPDSRTRGGAGGGPGGLGFAGPALPDQDEEFFGAGRHGELNVRSLREQRMVL